MKHNHTIYVPGHTGLVGRAVVRELRKKGFENILTVQSQVDLTVQSNVDELFKQHKIDYVFNCAAKVGGIVENKTYPADFLYQNIAISEEANITLMVQGVYIVRQGGFTIKVSFNQ